MQVKAIREGYYDHKFRKVGEVFTLKPVDKKDSDGKIITVPAEKLFSKNWMVKHDTKNQTRTFGKKSSSKNVSKAAHEPDVEEQEEIEDSHNDDVI